MLRSVQFDMTLNPSVLHTPIHPYDLFGEGHQEFDMGYRVIISN